MSRATVSRERGGSAPRGRAAAGALVAPADKRFRRAHVKPARRRGAWRRRLAMARVVVLAAIAGYAVYRAVTLVAVADVLRVRRVAIHGHARLSKGEVLALVDGLEGSNILLTNLDDWRRRLMSSPWVASAVVRRVLPSTIDVTIVERQPIGIGRFGRELFLVDGAGLVIDEYGPNYAEFDLPIIDGLAAVPRDSGPMVDATRADLAARLLAAVSARRDLSARLSQIDVTDPRDAVVVLEGETAVLHLGAERFVERLQAYVDLAAALHERLPEIDYIDLRFDDRIYVRPKTQGPG